MHKQILLAAIGLVGLAGCIEERPRYYHRRAVVVYQPAPAPVYVPAQPIYQAPPPGGPPYAPPQYAPQPGVAYQPAPAPVYVEEGQIYHGVVVQPVAVDDYVLIGGDYYYWHPYARCWVHAHPRHDWAPRGHVYHEWHEHPMYRGGHH